MNSNTSKLPCWVMVLTITLLTVSSNAIEPGTKEVNPSQSVNNKFALPGLSFNQVSFTFDSANVPNSMWGLLIVDVPTLTSVHSFSTGFLNVYTDYGWVVQNLPLGIAPGESEVSYYFMITESDGIELTGLSAFSLFTPSYLTSMADGSRQDYNVTPVLFNAEGDSLATTATGVPIAPGTLVYEPNDSTYYISQPNRSNIQAAEGQCYSMSVANSLQYLEDRYGLPVPHTHEPGLYGDNSLVGQLDSTMHRRVGSRSDGDGIRILNIFKGKFQYLRDNGLDDKLIHNHQGHNGDRTNYGVTSKDESVDGKVTWEWICDQIAKGEDVELVYSRPGGAHAIRVCECGTIGDRKFIGYVHDAIQADDDPGDSLGVNGITRAWTEDLDNDGNINIGSSSQEIVFALSESADTDLDGITNGLDNAPDHFNPGQEDEDDNGIGDVTESDILTINSIPPFDLSEADSSQSHGPYNNPLPTDPDHKDVWFVGTATNTHDLYQYTIIVTFSYVDGEGQTVETQSADTTRLMPGQTREIFGSARLDLCPEEVNVNFYLPNYGSPASLSNISGNLFHICYPPTTEKCCTSPRGNANGDLEDKVNVADVSYLVAWLFGIPSGPAPVCVSEANANGDSGEKANVADVSYLVSYLFGIPSGPPPGDCL